MTRAIGGVDLDDGVDGPAWDDGAAACADCGCTDDMACPGGCWWVEDATGEGRDICSACLSKGEA